MQSMGDEIVVIERARLSILPGKEAAFEAAVAEAVPYFLAAKGCGSVHLERIVEEPNIYVLVVEWATLEDHTVTFRGSDGFQEWRRLAGPFFAEPPSVEHLTVIKTPAV